MRYPMKALTLIISLFFISTMSVSCIEIPSIEDLNNALENAGNNSGSSNSGGEYDDEYDDEYAGDYDCLGDDRYYDDQDDEEGITLIAKFNYNDDEWEDDYEDCETDENDDEYDETDTEE